MVSLFHRKIQGRVRRTPGGAEVGAGTAPAGKGFNLPSSEGSGADFPPGIADGHWTLWPGRHCAKCSLESF